MPTGMHPPEIDLAFSSNPELRKRVHDAVNEYPAHSILFRDISSYILSAPSCQPTLINGEPATKKRKVENGERELNGAAGRSTAGTWVDAAVRASWQGQDTSFSVPQRKKLTLEMVKRGDGCKEGGIRGINPATGAVEFGVGWKNIEQIFCLPLPEKAKRQHNLIVIPVNGDGVNPVPDFVTAPPEPIVWTFAEATGKDVKEGEDPGPAPIAAVINECLAKEGVGKKVVFPDDKEFASAIVQSHRKGEKAFHVKAFRGSKDGFLFFTSVGILWAFKKPLAFFSFDTVSSISYTSVLQRTFNLNIAVSHPTDASKTPEFEFSMLDQADYAGIDGYIKKHGLQDASMAEQRKAKKLNVNPPAVKAENGAAGDGVEGEDGETELQKAERLLQEEDDEEEEDYDPGSEGESEGSGSSDEEDEGGEGYEEGVEEEEEYEEGEGYEEGYEERYDEGDEEMEEQY